MSNYWEKMKFNPSDMTESGKDKRREAYEKSHDIRKFEIGLFWQRATYYWAFILAAFTAHFALLALLFDSSSGKSFSCYELYNLPGLALFTLAVTAFFCYFFSLCWVLMNKGSKFWQKNWEEHIDELEQEFSGDLYKVIPNTENTGHFNQCSLSLKAYDYSVSKITSLTSVVLMIASFFMSLFYVSILVFRIFKKEFDFTNCGILRWVVGILILMICMVFTFFIHRIVKGNNIKIHDTSDYWINRKD